MSYGVKYRGEFNDTHGLLWKIDFLKDGYASTINDLILSGEPLKFEFLSDSDDIIEPIHETTANIKIVSTSNFQYSELYAVEDLDWKINIYKNASLYWTGWIISDDYQEPYEDTPYEVEIKASDGLNYLKEYVYCETDDIEADNIVYYDGRMHESEIILNILAKIGYTEFKEYCNIYEENMMTSVDDSPMDQVMVDVDVFKGKYCHEVLAEILRKYGAIIRQHNGIFEILRPYELTGATMYGRYFTGVSTKTSITYSPVQYINRSSNKSDIVQIPGGVLMVNSPVKKISIIQDYGYKESWIDNYDFKANTYISASSTFQQWTGVSCLALNAGYFNTGEIDGMLVETHNVGSALTKYMTQTFGTYALMTNDVLNMELDFMFFKSNAGTASGVHFYVEIKCGSKYLYMANAKACAWDASANYIDCYADAPYGSSEWFNLKRTVPGLPANGPLTIKIYGLPDSIPTVYPIIKNIRLYSTSTTVGVEIAPGVYEMPTTRGPRWWDYVNTIITFGIAKLPKAIPLWRLNNSLGETVTRTYESGNLINGRTFEKNAVLGDVDNSGLDNVIEQFAGSLSYLVYTLKGAATKFKNDWDSFYASGGVIVISNGVDIIFTSDTAGVNFTGATSISNVSGDLSGSVVNTVPNNAGAGQIDEVTWTVGAPGGRSTVNFYGLSHYVDYNTSLDQTAQDFVTNWAAAYAAIGVALSKVGVAKIRFVGPVGVDCGTTTVTQTYVVLVGSVTSHTACVSPVARVDTVTLTGTTGSANLTCDGVTHLVQIGVNDYTTTWNTRGGSENKEILKILADAIAAQGARPTQLIQMPVYEDNKISSDSTININGRFEDSINQYGGSNRTFAVSAGEFDVKPRMWQLDLKEIL